MYASIVSAPMPLGEQTPRPAWPLTADGGDETMQNGVEPPVNGFGIGYQHAPEKTSGGFSRPGPRIELTISIRRFSRWLIVSSGGSGFSNQTVSMVAPSPSGLSRPSSRPSERTSVP